MMAHELTSVEPLLPLLEHRPFAILSDIDGTIAPIVLNPQDARASERAREALRRLIECGVRVGFITGRALEKARDIVGVEGAFFAGNHGLNILTSDDIETPEEVRPYVAWAQQVIEEVCKVIDGPGVIVEDKGPIVAFHYRKAESEQLALAAIKSALAGSEAAKHFRLQEGRKVVELRPPLAIDKGTAVEVLAERMGANAVLTMGDDATDIDMFRGVAELRARGVPGCSVGVWNPEADPIVLEATDYFVRGVEGTEWLLEELLTAIRRKAPAGL